MRRTASSASQKYPDGYRVSATISLACAWDIIISPSLWNVRLRNLLWVLSVPQRLRSRRRTLTKWRAFFCFFLAFVLQSQNNKNPLFWDFFCHLLMQKFSFEKIKGTVWAQKRKKKFWPPPQTSAALIRILSAGHLLEKHSPLYHIFPWFFFFFFPQFSFHRILTPPPRCAIIMDYVRKATRKSHIRDLVKSLKTESRSSRIIA